ncbi:MULTISPECIES: PA2778 family cysteine peptidase [unclassified Halomonas]|uniref:PA2778 family cysteine peptidase n=1 Tax=unclassified Halomonas TaxID=2609666 RepID=UPI001C96EEDA|nr:MULTISPECIES: PA2778 family cysteine peptidase [unclassified Halomonas]MBY5926054.1 PA2778 family cysteine peptidase [Halomonas sp. DP4Y7-2]MBY6233096.1 PA2778 family cysteine peptidase [Halomonas sp. DP4Y7-1]
MSVSHVIMSSARLAGALALLAVLSGCAATPDLDTRRTQSLSAQRLLDDVPFHPQRDYQCGPATLAMSLNHTGVDVSVDDLIPDIYVPARKGSYQPEMLAATRRHGRIPFVLAPRLESLLEEVDAGRPVVVLQNLSLPAFPLWHFAIVNGYDLNQQVLRLRTGVTRQDSTEFGRFDATWQRSDRWAFVALPPGQLPVSLSASEAIQATSDFERVQGAGNALPAWEAVVERFPDAAMARFGQANAYHAQGRLEDAIDAWRAATQYDPELAPAWLNLGLTLASQDEPQEAVQALQRAAALPGPWQTSAQEALIELEGTP